jgi:hypothetical protein
VLQFLCLGCQDPGQLTAVLAKITVPPNAFKPLPPPLLGHYSHCPLSCCKCWCQVQSAISISFDTVPAASVSSATEACAALLVTGSNINLCWLHSCSCHYLLCWPLASAPVLFPCCCCCSSCHQFQLATTLCSGDSPAAISFTVPGTSVAPLRASVSPLLPVLITHCCQLQCCWGGFSHLCCCCCFYLMS